MTLTRSTRMNMYSAIRSLRDGQAVKLSTWRGYVKREDVSAAAYAAYDAGKTDAYAAGTSVLYAGSRYICPADVAPDPETGVIGSFDSSRWVRVEFDYDITFVDADSDDETPNPSAVYRGTVTLSGVTFERTGPASPTDMPDGELFTAIISDNWESGSTVDYETQRAGGSGRW